MLAAALPEIDRELSDFYASLVESEGNHYATYWLMARAIDEPARPGSRSAAIL